MVGFGVTKVNIYSKITNVEVYQGVEISLSKFVKNYWHTIRKQCFLGCPNPTC